MAERPAHGVLVRTIDTVEAVHIFSNRVVIVDTQGNVTAVDRFTGLIRNA